nr:Chain 2, TraB [Salmonella enterica]7OKO_7 Chain 7, TraB [Salmonella enterica]7OKO_AC Chain AC, TraB [Salmonella enterica]7OKO_E Chain E, TraB [Salmonella enterica]7OKO_J Chain J, TraB [Salmonella enterica]7OKO_O Chain O, TraB [Salmonella enterica]7OKO_T Chain T, TraB [Salmonella enterica]7OKO_Y Chain Y, TraB [Salmonella enterica]7OKO_d Chain d, TraB [Salmonella enterica]7OKO_i Chain i, TraB [Salmonella enterica]7OKO_n Chain n, TraB [Salmonella enterica]7OKO_s Chain s, TraB [Salmonella
PGMMDSQEFS